MSHFDSHQAARGQDVSAVHRRTECDGYRGGFIAFCETNLGYEKGRKAWILLGPYLLGAFVLEHIAISSSGGAAMKWTLWSGFFAYVTLFPAVWPRLLRCWSVPGSSTKSVQAPEAS